MPLTSSKVERRPSWEFKVFPWEKNDLGFHLSYHHNLLHSCQDQQDEPWYQWKWGGYYILESVTFWIFTMRINVDLSKAILSPLLAAIRTWTSFWLRDWKSKFWHIFEEIYQKKLISHLVILHSWTLFLVTFADAKVIKHVEPDIKLRERDDDQHLKCFPWQALGITWFTPTMLIIKTLKSCHL